MEKRNGSFEDFMNIVDSAHSKTASRRTSNKSNDSLLKKIAEELNLDDAAPAAEGQVIPAASSVAGANPGVVAATEAVAMPQVAISGGNPEESAAGELAAEVLPNEGLAISAGDGIVTDANNLHRTPEAVVAAAEGGGGDEGLGEEKATEAEKIGRLIAKSFQTTLEKQAEENDYVEALDFLKEAGLLDSYKIKDSGMSKQASYSEGCLEKIANNQKLYRKDIIGAAVEFIDMQKQASYAEEQGREDARNLVDFVANVQGNVEDENLQKQASDAEAQGREDAKNLISAISNERNNTEQQKIASALNDKDVVSAVKVLKSKGII